MTTRRFTHISLLYAVCFIPLLRVFIGSNTDFILSVFGTFLLLFFHSIDKGGTRCPWPALIIWFILWTMTPIWAKYLTTLSFVYKMRPVFLLLFTYQLLFYFIKEAGERCVYKHLRRASLAVGYIFVIAGYIGGFSGGARFTVFGLNENGLGAMFATLFLLSAVDLLTLRSRSWLSYINLPIFAIPCVLTGSRASVYGAIIALFIISFDKLKKLWPIFIVLAVGMYFLQDFFLKAEGFQRMANFQNTRDFIWEGNNRIIANHFWYGIGFRSTIEDYGWTWQNCHSMYYQVMVESGIIGFVSFITLYFREMWRSFVAAKSIASPLTVYMLALGTFYSFNMAFESGMIMRHLDPLGMIIASNQIAFLLYRSKIDSRSQSIPITRLFSMKRAKKIKIRW